MNTGHKSIPKQTFGRRRYECKRVCVETFMTGIIIYFSTSVLKELVFKVLLQYLQFYPEHKSLLR